ncbi:MAG TPA: ATP-binding protein [Hyphomicrobiaceae bacterium]|nr:ATP-binding protein [Hyphomicrobiaceae bacterium]
MWRAGAKRDHGRLRGQMTLLGLISSLAVAALVVAVLDGANLPVSSPSRALLLGALTAGAAALALFAAYRSLRARTGAGHSIGEEVADLRKSLLTAEAIIKAEPQVLVFWEQGLGVRVMTHTLATIPGLPQQHAELLRFGRWLDLASAEELKRGLDALFADGRPFSSLLKTSAGGHVEADGRAAGGRAILRLRDVAGRKRDLARILDQHRQLVRDTLAGRTLLDALPMPAWLRGADGRLQWVNEAYVKAVEAGSQAEVRKRQIELLETRQREAVAAALHKRIAYRQRVHLISSGTRKAHDVVVIPLDGASVGAAIDVAALETAQGELVRHVAAYERTLDRVATGVAIFGPDQRLTFFNEAYRALWQLDADWLATKPSDGELLDRLRELSRLPEVVNYRDWKAKILAGNKTGTEYEDWWHLLDGRTIHVVSAQRPDGGLTYLYDDATERFALESRYNALIDVQRETLDSLKEGVAVFATDGRLKLFNSAVLQIWRLPRSTLKEGPHIDKIIALCSSLFDDMATWARVSRAVTGISDRRHPVGGQMLRPDQSVIDFAVSPLPDGATLITFVDVTDSKRYEQTLIERNEALVAADRLKSQFISHVSYELRTPLTNIIGFSELLSSPRTGELNNKQREYLNDISASSRTLLAIINDILDLATIDAGALELKLAPIKAKDVVDTAILGVRDRANRARLNLDIAIAEDAVEFVADEARVRQVLYNLLANAIGFSKPSDTISVTVRREAGMMAFTVEDKGVGIPKDQQQRVLERFESRSQGSKHRGAGLGLAIVKSLVELHGGTMSLQSEPGQGTRVTVRFPENGAHAEPASEAARA